MKIEKVPIPNKQIPVIAGERIDFSKLKKGDSIFFPCENFKRLLYVRSRLSLLLKDTGIKYTTEEQEGGLRFWRK